MNTAVNSQENPWVAGAPVIQADAIHVAKTLGEKGWWRVRQYRGTAQLPTDLMTGGSDLDAVLAGLKSYMDHGMIKPAQIVLYIGGQVIEVTPEMLEVLSQ
jgi:hypothetical protein